MTAVSARKVPSTVVIPTASGRIVARPRKNSSESSSSTGNASSSARPRSSETLSPIWLNATALPPSTTSRSPAKRSSSAATTASSSASAVSVAATDAERPSRLVVGGETDAIPGCAASCALTSAARAGSRTRATTPGLACAPVACSIRASA